MDPLIVVLVSNDSRCSYACIQPLNPNLDKMVSTKHSHTIMLMILIRIKAHSVLLCGLWAYPLLENCYQVQRRLEFFSASVIWSLKEVVADPIWEQSKIFLFLVMCLVQCV